MKANTSLTAVMELDLEPIKAKLMHVASGEGWSREKADAVEKEYRRFLCLMKLYPHEETAPLVDVDTFWHYHILDTMKYAQDCEQVFGYFLHHYPYVGMRGGDDAQFRLDSGERMRELYEATFGEAYPVIEADTAFCAGPVPNDDRATTLAFCAGPVPNGSNKPIALAFCAGPVPNDRQAAALAFCAGPVPNGTAAGFAARSTRSVRDVRIEKGAITWQAGA
ncbi:glycine-rich domain-containing protein [Massilia sp. TN1-12]|uniref:glycine-rich domain-containing protein n=1 Tax=Massilia paldalensis TaxID=3377675 RepID=UPI00384F84D0